MRPETHADAVAVIYIAHRDYGVESLQAFLQSYHRHPAGRDHQLVIAFKALADPVQKSDFTRALDDTDHIAIDVPPDGFDIGTYFFVSRRIAAHSYCLFNSSTVLLADHWLDKLAAAFADPSVGIAGATGSWQSLAGYERRFVRPRPAVQWIARLRMTVRYCLALRRFPAYPNPHLRTNAILISSEILEQVRNRVIRTRRDATAFESGRRGLTRTVKRMGLRGVVVDRDGTVCREQEWHESGTFWQSDQERLLASDNRTRHYQMADAAGRDWLRSCAWYSP